ncbi:glutamate-5-semialdehyde dehydrogenase [Chitinophaga nivalis]|uniref:Gamma-glutamyl phosphate reductase n=1 Tax=Chitinophaga nivalis TaxID=2991709 RepID=A0ABT3IPH1_9BACT|nr:glutamate-5-semialdehyde dehydrogenase [Chitinophaga nivalis]MCW3464440.1 glutamate-5-semialdehyde dehydrogenase [Chitinophaga nivalis]MCW3485869.1 glutamate-5-semialdehyde dehydrogenase [Chitinophaga nivalis]
METILPLLEQAKQATTAIRTLPDTQKQALLLQLSQRITDQADVIIAENKKDLDRMADNDPKKDRLLLNKARIQSLAESLADIARLPDPANTLLLEKQLENGLLVQKKTVPLGVVGVIYESRPNVTVDVAALCIRSGNVCLLRGGSDAQHTNIILVQLIREVLQQSGTNPDIVQLLPPDRRLVTEMLTAVKYIDIIIPRGSEQLIAYVREQATVPVIETGAGVCHTYVEKTADLAQAARIVTNAKVSRPSVCNALDTVLVDEAVAAPFLALLTPMLTQHAVNVYAEPLAFALLEQHHYPYLFPATAADFGREFLSLQCSVKVVPDTAAALAHIQTYSSRHSEAIISTDPAVSELFLNTVDAAAVYVNASTRFTDGGVFGLGAEIGISTQKLHARGPFALEKLVTEKWFVYGNGQTR